MNPLLRCLLVAALLVGLGTALPAHSASRQATRIGGWSTAATTVAPGTTVSTGIRVQSGGRTWSRPVLLQLRPDGGAWRVVDRRSTRRNGRVRVRTALRTSGQLRVVVPRTRRARARSTAPRSVSVSVNAASRQAAELETEVVRRVNRLRSQGISCAGTWQRPVARVRPDDRLALAARTYARRMAVHRFFGHTDKVTGNGPGWRATDAGYSWSVVGENLAANYSTARGVIRAWRNSASHCRNMMDGRWKHVGVGWYRAGSDAPYDNYWGQIFGKP